MSEGNLFNVPIAFFIFNRQETTERVFQAIREAKPSRLLVVADGPRPDVTGEDERCRAVRRIIDSIDWNCSVLKNYADYNMGCRKRVSTGLNWLFQNVEDAIILEDDCLPNQSFFKFCEEMLDKYRYNNRITMVCGTNLIGDIKGAENSYFFSKYPHIWGWATWRRVWCFYDVDISTWPVMLASHKYLDFSSDKKEIYFWRDIFDRIYKGEIDTWDAQVTYMAFCLKGLSIIPKRNMVSNIGFGRNATHTREHSKMANLTRFDMEWPLSHPEVVMADRVHDELRKKLEYTKPNSLSRFVQQMKQFYGRIF